MSTRDEVTNNVQAARSKLTESSKRQLKTAYDVAATQLPDHLKFLDSWRLA